ncbi:hypothetical protein F4802DRAFT_597334 [Xylaria palmicola]|nr:hypothetical protein F4802DRAFT_597334 [Xylaria palmicola]
MGPVVGAGLSNLAESPLTVHSPGYGLPRPVPVRLRVIVAEKSTMGVRHTMTMANVEARSVAVGHPTVVTHTMMTRIEGKTRPFEIPTITHASDVMDLHHQDAILNPVIMWNITEIDHFLRPLESEPEAEAPYRFLRLDPSDPSATENATATATTAVMWKRTSGLNRTILRRMDLRDPATRTLLPADVPFPHTTVPLTVDMPKEAIIRTIPVATEVDRHLGRVIPKTA